MRQDPHTALTATRELPAGAGRPAARSAPEAGGGRVATLWNALEGLVLDLIYIGLTIVVFAALFLLIKGVERVER
ncbi:MAG TPA: hypothetical protein VMV92_34475 [Streptosporangiaceae bacterium]|nr:hypothetical protein [Streptosporangiaceae bacterium]